ncbi:hypothetical protein ACQPW1_00105 [Nocardia sp. CA-128927]|uniref:hypothetical protein n=1 Tax=Nocardia sp. CA-128927 TaxID=3239975 RepID=UPI003D975827
MLDLDSAEQYCLDGHVAAWAAGKSILVDMSSEDEDEEWDRDAESWLPAILQLPRRTGCW